MVFKIPEIACAAFFLAFFCGMSEAGVRTAHYSSYSDDAEVFSSAITAYAKTESKGCISDRAPRAGIVSHHLLAKAVITDFFECLSRKAAPERIILVGPDHFNKGLHYVSVSDLPWKTPFGRVDTDTEGTKELINAGFTEDDAAFMGEHSIGALVPFIKRYFPESRVVPVMVKNSAPLHVLRRLSAAIGGLMHDEKTLIMVSMDFSHGKTPEEARLTDAASREVILNGRIGEVYNLDVDCRACLYSLMLAARPYRAEIQRRSDSAEVSGIRDLKDVTSYFTIFLY